MANHIFHKGDHAFFKHPLFVNSEPEEIVVLSERDDEGSYYVACKEYIIISDDGTAYLDYKHKDMWCRVHESQLAAIA